VKSLTPVIVARRWEAVEAALAVGELERAESMVVALRGTRAWLVANSCFHEVQRGHWSLGYVISELAEVASDG